ncbi:protein THYLAKOID ASSEMBLY 8, chloroplastic-like [Rutidosis leptorrhynchoides]|uniref:protein THYLAKOID ASSEMBLY 8, chloroplastic-like n=1 Tax=Rutidosis leptorrhynchoides TaxID=125765 RepID=UPI003A9A4158
MNCGVYGIVCIQARMRCAFMERSNGPSLEFGKKVGRGVRMRVTMRDRSKNRKPLQKGRNLSIEAIQTVQALKRASKSVDQQQVIYSKFSRLLKFDMMAILRELFRQDQSQLALTVFAEIQKEHWYKPEVTLYAEMILVLARNGLYDEVDTIYLEMKGEKGRLQAKTEGFNVLLETLMSYNFIKLVMDCFELMKEVGCEPDRSTFKLLVSHLESKGETSLSESVRREAQKYYGDSIEFVDEQENMEMNNT